MAPAFLHRPAPAAPGQGVGVEEQQPVAPRRLGARRELRAPPLRRHDEARAGTLGDRHGRVGRTAVDDEDLVGALHALEAFGEMRLGVQRRDDRPRAATPQPEQLAPPRTQKRAQCGWLSATGRTARQRLAHGEAVVIGQGAGDDVRPRRALRLHHHPARRAHHAAGATCSRSQQPSLISGTSAKASMVGTGRDGRRRARAARTAPRSRRAPGLVAAAPAGDGDAEAGAAARPARRSPCARPRAALGLVRAAAVIVEADPHHDPLAMGGGDLRSAASKRRIGRIALVRTRLEAARQRCAHHRDHVPVHERLAAGEADDARRAPPPRRNRPRPRRG